MFGDPIKAAYESGEISKEEYEALSRDKEASLAREDPAYWELDHTVSQARAKLAHE